MPMGAYKDFEACMLDQMESKGRSKELAQRICGAMMRATEGAEAYKADVERVAIESAVRLLPAVWTTASLAVLAAPGIADRMRTAIQYGMSAPVTGVADEHEVREAVIAVVPVSMVDLRGTACTAVLAAQGPAGLAFCRAFFHDAAKTLEVSRALGCQSPTSSTAVVCTVPLDLVTPLQKQLVAAGALDADAPAPGGAAVCLLPARATTPGTEATATDSNLRACEGRATVLAFTRDEGWRRDKGTPDSILKEAWSQAYRNDLPDSAFLWIQTGGAKDSTGRTKPRSLRHFPVRDADGKLDAAHLRNAIGRIPQSNAPGLTAEKKQQLQERARKLLASLQKSEDASFAIVRDTVAKVLFKFAEPEPATPEAPAEDHEERYVLGIVLEPETVDAQGDIYDADAIRKTAHEFMEHYQTMGLMHSEKLEGEIKIVESYLAPVSFKLDGQAVKKGAWLLGAHVVSDALWTQVKSGTFNGWSMGGDAIRIPVDAEPAETT